MFCNCCLPMCSLWIKYVTLGPGISIRNSVNRGNKRIRTTRKYCVGSYPSYASEVNKLLWTNNEGSRTNKGNLRFLVVRKNLGLVFFFPGKMVTVFDNKLCSRGGNLAREAVFLRSIYVLLRTTSILLFWWLEIGWLGCFRQVSQDNKI